jgi:hypothetical protein
VDKIYQISFVRLHHAEDGLYEADASEIGFLPGVWPEKVQMRFSDGTFSADLERLNSFRIVKSRHLGGYFYGVSGVNVLKVFNDLWVGK